MFVRQAVILPLAVGVVSLPGCSSDTASTNAALEGGSSVGASDDAGNTAPGSDGGGGTSAGSDAGTGSAADAGASGGDGSTTGSNVFGIKVQGNHLVSTRDGSVVQLFGVSVSGLEQGNTSFQNGNEDYGNATDPGFAAMASWNMNVVRIPVNEEVWLGLGNCGGNGASAALRSTVTAAVKAANAAGLYVIIDLHWAAPTSVGCPLGQGSNPDADNTANFWTSVAQTFKDNPAVIFEMFNEPFGSNSYNNWIASINSAAPSGQSASDLSILRNGGTYSGFQYQNNANGNAMQTASGTFHAAGMQSLLTAIRATGATNVVLSNAIGWAGQIQTWLESKPNDPAGQLAAGWHEDGSSTSDAQAVLSANFPIIITEAYTEGDGTWTWAPQNHVGYLFWAWVDWGGSLLSDAKTHTPSSSGTQLKSLYCSQPKVNSLAMCP